MEQLVYRAVKLSQSIHRFTAFKVGHYLIHYWLVWSSSETVKTAILCPSFHHGYRISEIDKRGR